MRSVILASLLLSSVGADYLKNVVSSCTADIQALCPTAKSPSDLASCFEKNAQCISQGCFNAVFSAYYQQSGTNNAVASLSLIPSSCAGDVTKYCSVSGSSDISKFQCLLTNYASISSGCLNDLETNPSDNVQTVSAPCVFDLVESCYPDTQTLCPHIPFTQFNDLTDCMMTAMPKWSGKCKTAFTAIAQESLVQTFPGDVIMACPEFMQCPSETLPFLICVTQIENFSADCISTINHELSNVGITGTTILTQDEIDFIPVVFACMNSKTFLCPTQTGVSMWTCMAKLESAWDSDCTTAFQHAATVHASTPLDANIATNCKTEMLYCPNKIGYDMFSCLLVMSDIWTPGCKSAFSALLGAPSNSASITLTTNSLLWNPISQQTENPLTACAVDLMTVCYGTGGLQIFGCLMNNHNSISAACLSSLTSSTSVIPDYVLPLNVSTICAAEITSHCSASNGFAQFMCLLNSQSVNSAACNSLFNNAPAAPVIVNNIPPTPINWVQLVDDCADDINTLCSGVELPLDIAMCMFAHRDGVSAKCAALVTPLMSQNLVAQLPLEVKVGCLEIHNCPTLGSDFLGCFSNTELSSTCVNTINSFLPEVIGGLTGQDLTWIPVVFACLDDKQSLCPTSYGVNMWICMSTHESQWSTGCAAAFNAIVNTPQPSITPAVTANCTVAACSALSGYEKVNCLLQNSASWSASCLSSFESMFGAPTPPASVPSNWDPINSQTSPVTLGACAHDITSFCFLENGISNLICLVENMSQISSACSSALHAVLNSPENNFILDANVAINCQINLHASCASSVTDIAKLQCLVANKVSLTDSCLNALYPHTCAVGSTLQGCPPLSPPTAVQQSGEKACRDQKHQFCAGKFGNEATKCMLAVFSQLSVACQAAINVVSTPTTGISPLVAANNATGCGFFDANSGNPISIMSQVDLSTVIHAAYSQSAPSPPPQTTLGNAAPVSSITFSVLLTVIVSVVAIL